MTRDLRTSLYLLNLKLRAECSRTLAIRAGGCAGVEAGAVGELQSIEADAIGEQQSKRTQSGSSSRSGRYRGAAAEADAIGSSS